MFHLLLLVQKILLNFIEIRDLKPKYKIKSIRIAKAESRYSKDLAKKVITETHFLLREFFECQ